MDENVLGPEYEEWLDEVEKTWPEPIHEETIWSETQDNAISQR